MRHTQAEQQQRSIAEPSGFSDQQRQARADVSRGEPRWTRRPAFLLTGMSSGPCLRHSVGQGYPFSQGGLRWPTRRPARLRTAALAAFAATPRLPQGRIGLSECVEARNRANLTQGVLIQSSRGGDRASGPAGGNKHSRRGKLT
ncbi:hypothetical protein HPB50_004496 [Hyalomma asiaticum]|uniref:Uncharacterized protein n=1 Tax=Hyalomma asiaticum TaxID=266040 RepID=A0ACB7TCF5_HYAAI|nr:hypothetical protein HPB50_004496 [Hyalomma asiaticum]